jgi:hypothetical protein
MDFVVFKLVNGLSGNAVADTVMTFLPGISRRS